MKRMFLIGMQRLNFSASSGLTYGKSRDELQATPEPHRSRKFSWRSAPQDRAAHGKTRRHPALPDRQVLQVSCQRTVPLARATFFWPEQPVCSKPRGGLLNEQTLSAELPLSREAEG